MKFGCHGVVDYQSFDGLMISETSGISSASTKLSRWKVKFSIWRFTTNGGNAVMGIVQIPF